MLVTYFKTTLRCPSCGQEGTAWIQSHLGSRGATYTVGDAVQDDIPEVDVADTSLLVRTPGPAEPIHVLMSWTCEHCNVESFAEVVFHDGRVRSIDCVDLEPATLERLHYIAESLWGMLEEITGEKLWNEQGLRPDWLEVLRRALDSGSRWPSGSP